MSLVRGKNTVGIIVQSPDKYWHLATDTEPGADTEGLLYGFKHSWVFDQRPIAELARIFGFEEIDNPAIDAMNQTIQIWLELAESGKNADWKREKYGGKFLHGCPLCAYAESLHKETMHNCYKVCPMANRWGASMCDSAGATYNEWVHEEDPGQRKVKARAIVNEMIKVRAEMIANLEETKEETMENIVELNIEKKVTSKLRFKIDNDGGVRLIVVNKDGERMIDGTILRIGSNGTLWLADSINKDLGLQLDGAGRIVIE